MRRRLRTSITAIAAASVALAVAVPSATAQTEECTPVGEDGFEVCPDELFIFAVSFKPYEYGDFFDTYVGDHIREQFGEVNLKFAAWGEPITYDDLDEAGVVPDIVLETPRTRVDRELEPRGWVQDMTPLIEDSQIDLDELNPAAVEQIASRSDGGMYGVPLFINEFVLLYNKNIFDELGERYPEAGMTYDTAYRKARRLTQQVDLTAYKGYLQHPDNYLEFNQGGLYPFVDAGSEEPAPEDVAVDITTDEWMDLGRNLERFLLIPRNIFTSVDDFARSGRVAMAVHTLDHMNAYALSEDYMEPGDEQYYYDWMEDVEMGISTVPVLQRGSRDTYQPNLIAAFIPPDARKQAEAMAVIEWLVSEEGQIGFSESGLKAVLETDEVVDRFGAAIPELADLDTSAVYWGDNAVVHGYERTEYWDIPMFSVFRQHVLQDGMTVEAALTVAETVDIPDYIRWRSEAGYSW